MQVFTTLGPWIYPLAAVGVCTLLQTVFAARSIAGVESGAAPMHAPHHAIVAWGFLGCVIGAAGSLIGLGKLAVGARAIGGSEPAELEAMLDVFWDGVIVIGGPVVVGIGLLTISLVAWLGLDHLLRSKT